MTRAEEVAWAAGLFEGEGFFTANRYRRTDGGITNYLIAGISSTDEDVLRRFHRIIGVGSIFVRQLGDPASSGIVRRKPQWRWQVGAQGDFDRVAQMLRPFLGERRLARLDELQATRGRQP